MPSVRIIILNYKRQDNVLKIAHTFHSLNIPVSIINNNPDEHLPYLKDIDVINNDKNYYCMERWHRCFEYSEEFKVVIDDDLLPHPSLIAKMIHLNEPLVGIYGKTNVENATNYHELVDHWCENIEVDFVCGAVVCIKQSVMNKIFNDITKIGFPDRGDDIITSYLMKKASGKSKFKLVSGKVLNLPEGDVGLNRSSDHFTKRWNVLQKFKNIAW